MSTSKILITRSHEICMGHRVLGHEGKCRHIHGHNYLFEITVEPVNSLDQLGRVIDFSVIKSLLCEFLENNWDHKFMVFEEDPLLNVIGEGLYLINNKGYLGITKHGRENIDAISESLIVVKFNPTVENIAQYFVDEICPKLIYNAGLSLEIFVREVKIFETSKCSATYKKECLLNE